MKFKKGDRVVVLHHQYMSKPDKYPKGEVFEIGSRAIEYNELSNSNERYFKEDDYFWAISAEDLELEHVFNSPLYKALR